jgi:aldose 1-epimerase
VIAPSGEQYELVWGDQRAVVVEVGGGLRAYGDVLDGYPVDEMCRSARGQVLAPWPNRIADGVYEFDGQTYQLALSEPAERTAIHGLVRWASWRAVERDEARVVLEHVLHPQPGYPFTLLLQVEYRLGEDGLAVRTTAENVGRAACPFGCGHHPYIAPGAPTIDDMVVRIPGREPKRLGSTQLDTTFTDLTRDAHGRWRLHAGDVTVWGDEAWPYVHLFTGDLLPDVARRSLAVEPMTCPVNAFRTGEGLIRLEAGNGFAGTWGIQPARGLVPGGR